jgi:hypothetical protein
VSGIEHFIHRFVWYKRFPLERGERAMEDNREKWMELCAQAASEQDSEKLMKLIVQTNQMLEAKEQRLKGQSSGHEGDTNSPKDGL